MAVPDALFGSAVLCSKASQVKDDTPSGRLLLGTYATRHHFVTRLKRAVVVRRIHEVYLTMVYDPLGNRVPCSCMTSTMTQGWAQGAVTLQSPGYADGGPFAINVWAKAANASEQGPQYVFSHEAANASTGAYNAWAPNMVPAALLQPCLSCGNSCGLSSSDLRPVLGFAIIRCLLCPVPWTPEVQC